MTDSEQNRQNGKPKRRPRYSGTHPVQFNQKYKEHHIEEYPELKDHLLTKGKTPAGTHIPILTAEILDAFNPVPGQIAVDCTIGYGGHACQILRRLGPTGKLIGMDIDGEELQKTQQRLAQLNLPMSLYRSNFAGIGNILQKEGLDGVDIIFADLGLSSMQIDNPARGMSYKHAGPLDMRMDDRRKNTAADLLNTLSEEELSTALWELSDEPDHAVIAGRIVNQRSKTPFSEIEQLVTLIFSIKGLTSAQWKRHVQLRPGLLHPAARTFQALRILVNDEMAALRELLRLAPHCLKSGGRIGIISFHSGEDRLVKKSFAEGLESGLYRDICQNIITPQKQEVTTNPRSASAKFRWAVRA